MSYCFRLLEFFMCYPKLTSKAIPKKVLKIWWKKVHRKSFSMCLKKNSSNFISKGLNLLVWVTHKNLSWTDGSVNFSFSNRGLLYTLSDLYLTLVPATLLLAVVRGFIRGLALGLLEQLSLSQETGGELCNQVTQNLMILSMLLLLLDEVSFQ